MSTPTRLGGEAGLPLVGLTQRRSVGRQQGFLTTVSCTSAQAAAQKVFMVTDQTGAWNHRMGRWLRPGPLLLD